MSRSWDVVVVGGGHNGLVAAAYLARAGLDVCVLERDDHVGGAAISHRAFAGIDARVSRYSYLLSLLPDRSLPTSASTSRSLRARSRRTRPYGGRAGTPGLFGSHTPARLFGADNDAARAAALRSAVSGVDGYLAEPLEDCLLSDADGRPCIEAVTPVDLEVSLGLPGGHIFHGALDWPWAELDEPGRWGVETNVTNILCCGAGARRGGGVQWDRGPQRGQLSACLPAPGLTSTYPR